LTTHTLLFEHDDLAILWGGHFWPQPPFQAAFHTLTATEDSMPPLSYPASFRPDEFGRPVVHFPDFPHAHADRKDAREAMEEAIDCLGSVIAHRIVQKENLPLPSKPKRGQRMVVVPFWIAGKLALYLTMRQRCSIPNTPPSRRNSKPPSALSASE